MATPTSKESRLHARGMVKGSAWGTALAVGAGDEVLLVHPGASGMEPPKQPIEPALESDTPFVKKSELGLIPAVDIVVPFRMRYEMGAIGGAIAALYGTAGAPSLLGTTAYQHVFQWKDEISGLFFTYVEERPSKIFEAQSAKPYRLELNFVNGVLMGNLSLRCNNVIETSAVNTASQVDALTVPSNFYDAGVQGMFAHGSVKLNAESGGDVDSETPLVLEDFNVVIERPMESGIHVAGSNEIIEPLEGGLSGPNILITLNFPRSDTVNQAFFATFLAGTEQKAKIQFTGGLIEATYYYDFSFFFPRLKMQSPEYTVEEIVKGGLVLQAEESLLATPTGMDYDRPYLEVVNLLATDYLA